MTPAYALTATERVLPRLLLDWTTGSAQSGVDVVRAGVATFVGSNGLIQPASANTQRIDWSSGVAGILIEESRTNLLLRSQEFNTGWTYNSAGAAANTTVAPDGTTTADTLTFGNTAISRGYQAFTGNGSAFTFSVFAKYTDKQWIAFLLVDSGGVNRFVWFDVQNGVVGTTQTGITASVVASANGFYRCIATIATTATVNYAMIYGVNGNGSTSNAGQTGSVAAWGAQLEAGAKETSYIPTTTTAVTRNADVATMTGTNFSDWYNPTEGTFSIDCIINTNSAAQILMEMSDGTSANRFQYQRDSGSNNLSYLAIVSGSISVNLSKTATFVNDAASIISAYKLNNYGIAVNGGATTTDTSSGVPIVDRMRIGATVAGAAPSSGWYQKLFYYPQRLTNAEIQAFSK